MASTTQAFTEKSAPTYSTSGDARLDFFFHITEDANADKTVKLMCSSWTCDALDTLKLVAYLRDIRNGKGIRLQYQICLSWLYDNHRNTLFNNLQTFVSFGYWKDLLHLLMTILFEGIVPQYLDESKKPKKKVKSGRNSKETNKRKRYPLYPYDKQVFKKLRSYRKAEKKTKIITENLSKPVIEDDNTICGIESQCKQIENIVLEDENKPKTVLDHTKEINEKRKQFSQIRYQKDENYRKFFDKIVALFAEQLKLDIENMQKNVKSISLAGKWIPSIGKHFDKYLSISNAIAIELSKLMNKTEILGNADLIKSFYQKEVCIALRNYLKIPEVYMSSKKWSEIEYNRVASKCMQKNKTVFIKYDKQRFEEYLASKKTIAGATLKPIELVVRGWGLLHSDTSVDKLEKEVLEKQWLSLFEDIQKKGGGLLSNAIAVCDVSGSMNGEPMNAAIGLTILSMQMSSPPWNSLCITFHETPSFHSIEPESGFLSKLESLRHMEWGGTTNFNAVFDLIIEKAVTHQLTNEQMPKLLFVFTDMEFDSAFPGTSKTNYEMATQTFKKAGYTLPSIAFWNLRSNKQSMSTPVQLNELGTLLLSGYSGQQLSLVLKNEDFSKLTPMVLMRQAIDNKRYDALKVFD